MSTSLRTLFVLCSFILGMCLPGAAPFADELPADLGVEPELVVGPPESPARTEAGAAEMAESIADRMRCPVCQGLSVGDSPTEAARHMYDQIEELAAQGFSEDQIFDYFEESYGAFIRLQPRFEGISVWVWVLPLLVLLAGLVAFTRYFLARRATPGEATLKASSSSEPPEELHPFLAQVRAETRPGPVGD